MVDDTHSTTGLNDRDRLATEWIIPLSEGDKKLKDALAEMEPFKLLKSEVPLVIRFMENPKFSFFNIFPGAVTLKSHDCIHTLLGRGLLPKDEAFVIGFTMGTTKKLGELREWLFLLITRYLYPEGYKFYKEEWQVFRSGVDIGSGMGCVDLTKVDFDDFLHLNLRTMRKKLGVSEKKLRLRYSFEKKIYKNSIESQRLVP